MENLWLYAVIIILEITLIFIIKSEYALMCLLLLITVEPFVLMFLSGYTFLIVKYNLDIFVAVFVVKALYTAIQNRRPIKCGLTAILSFFLVVWAISTTLNGTPMIVSLVALRTIGRFVLLYLVMINLDLGEASAKRIVTILFIAGIIQVGIASMQLGSPDLQAAMKPPLESEEFTGVPLAGPQVIGGLTRVFGTTGRYNNLGFFLCMLASISIALYVNSPSRLGRLLYLLLSLVFTVFVGITTSRMALGTILAALILIPLYAKRKKWLLGIPILFGILIISLLVMRGSERLDQSEAADANIVDRMLGLASSDYAEQEMSRGRYYILTDGVLQILEESPLYGLGPGTIGSAVALFFDYTVAYQRINVSPEVFAIWSDVGWSTYIAQLGLLGFLAILLIFWKLSVIARRNLENSTTWFQRAINQAYLPFLLSFATMWMISSNALEFKFYAFFFWFFTAIVVLGNQEIAIERPVTRLVEAR
jgi:hypothetical protein